MSNKDTMIESDNWKNFSFAYLRVMMRSASVLQWDPGNCFWHMQDTILHTMTSEKQGVSSDTFLETVSNFDFQFIANKAILITIFRGSNADDQFRSLLVGSITPLLDDAP